jgi:two-component system, NarL family, nitrate/nitrite response regulator NarL
MSETTPVAVFSPAIAEATASRRITLFGPESLFHDALRCLIEARTPGTTVKYVTNERELVEAASDLVLLDIDLDVVTNGRLDEVTTLLAQLAPRPVLLISGGAEPDVLQRLLRDGVAGVVRRTVSCDTLMEAIDAVAGGKVWLQRELLVQTVADTSHASRRVCSEAPKIAQLTERERHIVSVVCQGLTNRQVGQQLHISDATVRHHLSSIFAKLGTANRGELIVFAYRHGLCGGERLC